ncbi:MAG: HAMP domain-containing histidine kinase [Kiritimatiellae bacterium]|nr:HAMP domain-containing histidine kinase [Kiritimatiellia bacterium]
MTKEIRIFIFMAILPVLLGAAAGIVFVRTTWQKMLDDERRDLETHAELMADALMGRIIRADLGDPHAHHNPAVSRHPPPPRHVKEINRSTLRVEDVAPLCADMRAAIRTPDTAFEIQNIDGSRFVAEPDWPVRHDLTGRCDLAPPLGDKVLVTARVDGGAGLRFRVKLLFASTAAGVLLLTSSVVLGAFMLMHILHHERRDARAKADFFDNVSHELKTPLAGIRLNAELLARGRIPTEELRHGALEAIILGADRLERMVDELLAFRRLEKGTRRYNLETFDLEAFACGSTEVQGVSAVSQGRAEIKSAGPGVTVTADKEAMRQIFMILISNALKYSEDAIEIVAEGNTVRCMDRGPGVPHGDEERVFERFYRADDSLTRRVDGSGLGLTIARGLARGMGGDLTYAHRPGGGSVFTLTLKEA